MDENRGGYGCKDCLNRVKGCFFMCVRIPEDAAIDPKFGSWTSSFLTQRRRGAEKTVRFEFFESYLLLCNPTLSTPRWVKIHSVRKILVFSIFPITSLFLCVTLRLAAPCSPSGSRRSGNPTTQPLAPPTGLGLWPRVT